MAKRPDTDRKVQFILHAEIHGDEAACARYKLSRRSLQNYRQEARDPDSELARTFASYAQALARPEERAETFAEFLQSQVRKASAILIEKAGQINAANPEGLRAVNDHVATLLDHAAALEYIGGLFGPGSVHGGTDDEATG